MSDFWLRKMRTYFTRIDVDRDGNITRADFEKMANNFAAKSQIGGADALRTRITALWDNYLGVESGNKPISQDCFIEIMKKQIDNPDLKDKLRSPLPLLFKAVDTDQDGQISPDEYRVFFQIIDINPDFADGTFKAIDTNSDGLLSEQEFIDAGVDFFTNPNESSNQEFWGPLV